MISLISLTLILITTFLISAIFGFSWYQSAKKNLNLVTNDINNSINQKIEWFFEVPKQMDEAMNLRIRSGALDLTNENERDKYFVTSLKTRDSYIYSFSYGSEQGAYYGARRSEDGSIQIMDNDETTNGNSLYYTMNEDYTKETLVQDAGKFDPRTRDWYTAAKEKKELVFSPIYKHFFKDDLCVSVALPVYSKDGSLQGVLGTHLILSDMNQYLKDISSKKSGISFIVEKDSGSYIANSLNLSNFIMKDKKISRYTPDTIGNKEMSDMYNRYLKNNKSSFEIDNYQINISEFKDNGIDWVVFVAVPIGIVMDDVQKNVEYTIFISIGISIIAILIFSFVVRLYLKRFHKLLRATRAFTNGDLDVHFEVVRRDEFGILAIAFNEMVRRIKVLVNNLEELVDERTKELTKANEMLEEQESHLSLILNSTAEAIFGIDMKGICTFCNASCVRLLKYESQDEIIGKSLDKIIYGEESLVDTEGQNLATIILESLDKAKMSHGDNEQFLCSDKTYLEVEYFSYLQWKEGKIIGAVITFLDISERKRTQEHIEYLNTHDFLTGLYNRRFFEEYVVKIDAPQNLPISIIFADVNGLKLTNDVFGHSLGDALIKRAGDILRFNCREDDIVARIGGDEFIILLPKTDEDELKDIIGRIDLAMRQEQIGSIRCSVALGGETKRYIYEDISRIIEDAENNMYQYKTNHRNQNDSDMLHAIVNSLHSKSETERKHSENVRDICEKIGHKMELPKSEMKRLTEIAFIHDIGKVILSDEILRKVEKREELTKEEQQLYDQHAIVGYRILSLFGTTLDYADGVYAHHEHWDGSGFPKNLKGEEIPLISRIIAIADAFDNRKRKDMLLGIEDEINEILSTLEELKGKYYDPNIVEIFIEVMKK